MLTKSRGAIAASALAIVAAGGSLAVIHAASPGPAVAARAALPVPVGTPATATVPAGSVTATAATGGNGTAPRAGGSAAGTRGPSAAARAAAAALPRSAGQGDQGPLPAGTVPADGAVPGAAPALHALAAERAALTVLPHSPQLMSELAGPNAAPSPVPTAITAPTASPDPTATVTPTATAAPTESATPSPTATGTPGGGPTATPTPTSTSTSTPPAATPTPTATGTPTGTGTGTPTATPAPSTGSGSAAAAVVAAFVQSSSAAAPAAAAKNVYGLDVAGYQHANGQSIGWSLVAGAGYKFAAVKGTEGDYYVNPWASTDMAQAKAAGLDVAPYHFAIPNASTGTEQAEYAVEYSGYATGVKMLPLMLDIEYDPYVSTDGTNECYGLSTAKMTAWVAAFVKETRALTGQYPVIYSTANWWDTCTGGSRAFAADPMWVAAYGFTSPPMPAGWSAWTFWQYTSGGTVPGVDSPGATDLDSFSPRVVGLINPGRQASRWQARVSVPISSLGGLAHERLRYSASGLPPGLAIGTNGMISGTLTGVGSAAVKAKTFTVRLSARNAAGAKSSVAFSWQVIPLCTRYRAYRTCPGA